MGLWQIKVLWQNLKQSNNEKAQPKTMQPSPLLGSLGIP